MAIALKVAAVAVIFAVLSCAPVLAQAASSVAPPGSVVVIPEGDWAAQVSPIIHDALLALVTGLVAWALRSLPAGIRVFVTDGIISQVDDLLDKAVDWGIAAVAGATKDKVWTITVGNAVVAKAVQYVIDHGPAWLITWMGGQAAITQKVIARVQTYLPVEAQVTGGTTITAGTPPT